MKKKLVILTGPSGSGKTTIAQKLIQKISYLSFTISVTTRAAREDEIHGKDYYFTNLKDFQKKISNNEFVEYEEVYKGKFYGTLYSEFDRIWTNKKHPLRVVDIFGAKSLKEKFSQNALTIFIRPPSLKVLEKRLIDRNSDSFSDIKERASVAKKEMDFYSHFDKIIVNDNLEKSVVRISKIIDRFILY